MFSVMIVEDELLVRIGLKKMIDWEAFGIMVVAEAANGQEALALYERYRPDLILTDIKMPVMDGIELIAKIREIDSHTKFVILTCYEDFGFLHTAMELRVSDYIVKLKMSKGDIVRVIQKVRDEMVGEERRMAIRELPPPEGRFEDALREHILHRKYADPDLRRLFSENTHTIGDSRLVMCALVGEAGAPIPEVAFQLIRELVSGRRRGIAIRENDNSLLLLYSFFELDLRRSERNTLLELLHQIQMKVKLHFGMTPIIGVSSGWGSPLDLHRLYEEAHSALTRRYFAGDADTVRFWDADYSNALEERFQELVKRAYENRTGIPRQTMRVDNPFKGIQDAAPEDVQNILIRIIHQCTADAPSDGEIEKSAMMYVEKIRHTRTFEDALVMFEHFLADIDSRQESARLVSREVTEISSYIREHFAQPITLRMLAERVGISPGYLSSLFKDELGVNLITYMNSCRVEKAKELLLNTQMKTYEISNAVGFSDESYFSRVFKKHAGMRPHEFKKSRVSGIGIDV